MSIDVTGFRDNPSLCALGLAYRNILEGIHRVTEHTPIVGRATFRQIRKKIVALLKRENVAQSLVDRICDSMSHVNDPTFASRLTNLCNRLTAPLLDRMEIDPFGEISFITKPSWTLH